MRLSASENLFQAVADRLDARLEPGAHRAIAVAFSGGGDSLALLLAAHAWAQRRSRRLLVLTVDHRLHAASSAWTAFCAARSRALRLEHRVLPWIGDKPAAGLPAAARDARHALIAEAARKAGAGVVLMGHTADDRFEAVAMRQAGSAIASPREWSPSPAWPEGRRVFLLRPMLNLRRADIRDALIALGEPWIDDPANTDPRWLRARVRAAGLSVTASDPERPDLRPLVRAAKVDWAGQVIIASSALALAGPSAARAFLSAAVLCAAGTARPPRSAQLQAVLDGLEESSAKVFTLAGSRITVENRTVSIGRDPGRLMERILPAPEGQEVVFDGRFEIAAPEPGWSLAPASGRLSRFSSTERGAVLTLPPPLRGALPVVFGDAGWVHCPLLDAVRWRARNLVKSRLMAACGVIENEATLSHVGEMGREALNQWGMLEGSVHELA